MFYLSIQVILLSIIVTIGYFGSPIFKRPRVPKGLCLPPGPPRRPIVGNAWDLPTHHEWETYEKWSKEYGEIVYLELYGTPVIYLNSRRVVYELFEKRSSLYSDRPHSPMLTDLMGFRWALVFHRYGDWWRRHRRLMHEKFHPGAVEIFKPIQTRHTRRLLRNLLLKPEGYSDHIRHWAGAIIMEIAYGIHVKPEGDPYVRMADEAQRAAAPAAIPGHFLVDIFPWMNYIPQWAPGGSFKKTAESARRLVVGMAELPFQAVKAAMAVGKAEPSFTSTLLEALAEEKDVPPDAEEVIRNTAAVIFAGGADTTVNTLKTFILAMALFPEPQKKAQQELDTVLGGRLVEFDDIKDLPYVVAVYKETLRWQPLLPVAQAHVVTQDDVFEGNFIPKGALIYGNGWSLLHDEKDFGLDTNSFNPDRFSKSGVRDPGNSGVFGYGRRVCPGRYMAENNLFISVASILQHFDISRPKDSSGKEVPIPYEFTSGVFSFPLDPTCGNAVNCIIKSRSKEAEAGVRGDESGVPRTMVVSEYQLSPRD